MENIRTCRSHDFKKLPKLFRSFDDLCLVIDLLSLRESDTDDEVVARRLANCPHDFGGKGAPIEDRGAAAAVCEAVPENLSFSETGATLQVDA